MRSWVTAGIALLQSGCVANGGGASAKVAPPVAVAAVEIEPAVPAVTPRPELPDVAFGSWEGFGIAGCSYLAPKDEGLVTEDGGVDVVFHFHAGQMSTRDMVASGVRGVFVSCGYGLGSGSYSKPFESPARFGGMMKRLLATVGKRAQRPVHLRHLALASWSAGFASVGKILAVPEWYAKTDSVVLLDSLHAGYTESGEVDARMLRHFVRFAVDARAGKKTMVITHSAIVPPGYASSAEATATLLAEAGLPGDHAARSAEDGAMTVRVDDGDLHVRGFRGSGPHDHFDHLHRIGETLRSWVVPRWYTAGQ